ncbi:MAG: DUF1465 family protein [Alteraurantiacibacter sp. bin_em_oilr2.035]|nr:DUF1465 family protein [Alteraurantiacibacter sp. bin_em_oilr2.035]
MTCTNTITPAIVDAVYEEALDLTEEARTVFEADDWSPGVGSAGAETQIVLSREALRATTRLMHAMAWLLNHKAFFSGELSAMQLQRNGRLPSAQPESDPAQVALLDPLARLVIARSRNLFARVERLDKSWQLRSETDETSDIALGSGEVHQLRQKLGRAFASN